MTTATRDADDRPHVGDAWAAPFARAGRCDHVSFARSNRGRRCAWIGSWIAVRVGPQDGASLRATWGRTLYAWRCPRHDPSVGRPASMVAAVLAADLYARGLDAIRHSIARRGGNAYRALANDPRYRPLDAWVGSLVVVARFGGTVPA